MSYDIERIKKEKDGLDVLADIYLYAVLGESVEEDDIKRFEWYGLKLNKNSSSLEFTLKIKLINALLTIEQLEMLCKISKEFAKNSLRFVSRQNIELDNIKIFNVPAIFNLLNSVGLNSIFANGHVPTNIMSCPINGYNPNQADDVSELVEKLNESFEGNKNFSNLPNELKILIDGCGCIKKNCQDNDIFFKAIKSSNGKIQFEVTVGVKDTAVIIGYIAPSQVVPFAKAIAKIYRDFGNRTDKNKSKLSNLVADLGFNKFISLLQSELTFKIKDTVEFIDTKKAFDNYYGVFQSNKENYSFVGFHLENKDLKAQGLEKLYELMQEYNASKIKITPREDIIVLDVPTKVAKDFEHRLKENF